MGVGLPNVLPNVSLCYPIMGVGLPNVSLC